MRSWSGVSQWQGDGGFGGEETGVRVCLLITLINYLIVPCLDLIIMII